MAEQCIFADMLTSSRTDNAVEAKRAAPKIRDSISSMKEMQIQGSQNLLKQCMGQDEQGRGRGWVQWWSVWGQGAQGQKDYG